MAALHHPPQLPPDVYVLLKGRQQQVLVGLQAVVQAWQGGKGDGVKTRAQ